MVVSRWVLTGVEPIRMVIHHEVGDCSVLCGTVDSPGDLSGCHCPGCGTSGIS